MRDQDRRLHTSTAQRLRLLERARAFRRSPTASEARLWQALRRHRLEAPVRRQQVIGPFIVDFFIPSHRLVIEVDGPIHTEQQDRDRERQALLESCGYRVLRVTAEEVEQDLASVLAQITLACTANP